MLTTSVCLPLGEQERVRMIQRTYNNTWTILIQTFDRTTMKNNFYIKHTKEDGTEIQVYKQKDWIQGFELVSESKILIHFVFTSSFIVIDLLKGSSKFFQLPTPAHRQSKVFRFCQSGLICRLETFPSSLRHPSLLLGQCPYFQTFSYYSQSSLEEGKPLLEYKNFYGLHNRKHICEFSILGCKANEHSLITSYQVLKGEDKSRHQIKAVKGFPFKPELEVDAFFDQDWNPSVFCLDGRICWTSNEEQSLKIFDPEYSSWDSISYQQIQKSSYQRDRISITFDKQSLYPDRSFQRSSLNPSILFYHYLNQKNRTITILTLEFFTMKDKLMHLLLGLNEDFDDDILLDALDMIDCL